MRINRTAWLGIPLMSSKNLFDSSASLEYQPLSRRMRPRNFAEFKGQKKIAGVDSLFRKSIESGRLFSYIFFGPPGCGKSALASLVTNYAGAEFVRLNAVTSNLGELKKVLQEATDRLALYSRKTILFIDEIHRFNKLQQDGLLPGVEEGSVFLIGVTTKNPNFYLNRALLSRCHLLEFEPLQNEDIKEVLQDALDDEERGLGKLELNMPDEAKDLIAQVAAGDVRKALNILEIGAYSYSDSKTISLDVVIKSIDKRTAQYDRDGDGHYDVTSAFIKSMRGSDPDATVHYLVRMINGGEDPRFIMRRIMIAASEDVGLAESNVLVLASAAATAVENVGMPEAGIIMAHAALRVALAPKSNSSYMAYKLAMEDLAKNGTVAIPPHLKDSHYKMAKELERGVGYKYPHDFENHFVKQEYLSEEKSFYHNSGVGFEKKISQWIDYLKKNLS